MKFQTENYESKSGGGNIPAGNYEFIVSNAEERESKAGNPMINLELLIVVPGRDNPVKVFDCLVFTDKAIFKIEQFCKAVGMPEKFQNNDGNVDVNIEPADCLNKQGIARFEPDPQSAYLRPKFYIEPTGYQASPKDKTPTAPASPTAPPARNMPPAPPAPAFKAAAPPVPAPEEDSNDPDDIPF